MIHTGKKLGNVERKQKINTSLKNFEEYGTEKNRHKHTHKHQKPEDTHTHKREK